MNSRTIVTRFRKYSVGVVLAGLGLMAGASLAVAQNTLSAGSVSAAAGGSAVVPITVTLGTGVTVADLSVTFSAVPQGSQPAVTDKLTFQVQAPLTNPDLTDNTSVPGSIAIGWVNDELSLTGTTQIGTVTVPIPASAGAGTYQLALSHIGALDPSDNDISSTFTAGAGTITVTGGGPTATPTSAPTTNTLSAGSVSAAAGGSAVVPITIALLSGVTVADLSVTFSAVPQGSQPAVTDKLTFQVQAPLTNPDLTDNTSVPGSIAIGWVNDELSLTGTTQIGTVTVPIPASAGGGTYQLTLSHIGALDPSGNDISSTFTAGAGTVTVGGTPPPVTPPTNTPVPPTNTPTSPPTNTPTSPPTNTPTTKPSATPTATTGTPATATATPTASATPQVIQAPVAAASAGATTLTIQGTVPANFPTSGTITAVGTTIVSIPFTLSGNTLTLSSPLPGAVGAVAAGTMITVVGPTACPTCEDNDSCQIGVAGHGVAWLLLIPAVGLLVLRRRSR